jgi:hypothetical protein
VEAEDPLKDLADIHLPATVSWWPPAPVWWLVAALVVAALAYAGLLLFRRWQQGERLKLAVSEIRTALANWQQANAVDAGQAGLALLYACNSTLKRVALVHYPDTDVASLHGRAWLAFLDHSGLTNDFTNGPAQALADGGYRRSYTADATTAAALAAAAERWISRQYTQAPQHSQAARPAADKQEAAA